MSCARGAQRGLTLIELIIYIVVVLVGLAGVLTVFNTTVRGSADLADGDVVEFRFNV